MNRFILILLMLAFVSCSDSEKHTDSRLFSLDSINNAQHKEQMEQLKKRHLYSILSIDNVITFNQMYLEEGSTNCLKGIYKKSLFFRWTDEMCSLCVDQELNRLASLPDKLKKGVVLIPSLTNKREYHSLRLKFEEFQICNLKYDLGTRIEDELFVAYYFTLDSNRVKSVFIPQYEDSTNIEIFINHILK